MRAFVPLIAASVLAPALGHTIFQVGVELQFLRAYTGPSRRQGRLLISPLAIGSVCQWRRPRPPHRYSCSGLRWGTFHAAGPSKARADLIDHSADNGRDLK